MAAWIAFAYFQWDFYDVLIPNLRKGNTFSRVIIVSMFVNASFVYLTFMPYYKRKFELARSQSQKAESIYLSKMCVIALALLAVFLFCFRMTDNVLRNRILIIMCYFSIGFSLSVMFGLMNRNCFKNIDDCKLYQKIEKRNTKCSRCNEKYEETDVLLVMVNKSKETKEKYFNSTLCPSCFFKTE